MKTVCVLVCMLLLLICAEQSYGWGRRMRIVRDTRRVKCSYYMGEVCQQFCNGGDCNDYCYPAKKKKCTS